MEINEIVEMIKFLFDNKLFAHIDTKDKAYFNGEIKEIKETFIVLNDRYWGMTPVSYSNIKTIEKFREKKEEGERKND